MEILETNKVKASEKNFTESKVSMVNRSNLSINGVERIFETNESKIQLKVAGVNMCISGENLNIAKLDVETGVLLIDGLVDEIKYSANRGKQNILKKLFK